MKTSTPLVGIEASSLFGQRTGVGYYIKYLAEGFAQLCRVEREARQTGILLLNHRPSDGSSGLPFANRWHFPLKPVWFQLCLPQVARQLKLDLLHFPNYMTPLRWEGPCVLTVHDLSVLHYPEWHPPSRRLILGNLLERSARRADLVFCVSSSVREDVVGATPCKSIQGTSDPSGRGPAFQTCVAGTDFCGPEKIPIAFPVRSLRWEPRTSQESAATGLGLGVCLFQGQL